jgi:hypothetical protein
MGELVREVLRSCGMLNEGMRNRFGVRGGRIEGNGCRGQGIECLLALRCETCSQLGQYALVMLVPFDLPL